MYITIFPRDFINVFTVWKQVHTNLMLYYIYNIKILLYNDGIEEITLFLSKKREIDAALKMD